MGRQVGGARGPPAGRVGELEGRTALLTLSLQKLVLTVLDELDAHGWTVTDAEPWCRVTPPQHAARVQGWKLHVSTTALAAPLVLTRAAEVLVSAGCAFKFARDLDTVEEMTSAGYDRAQCGKIITAYPRDDDQFRTLAAALDAATAGCPGPAILSDRQLRPGSLVHYRYGVFEGVPHLSNDGSFEARLRAPDGSAVPDVRKPWFCPPSWAELPLEGGPVRAAQAPSSPATVLLADRFEAKEALRFSARGGVYRALDHRTGAEVVLKQARPHVSGPSGWQDARSLQDREAAALTVLSGLGPELVGRFEKDGHSFLAESLISGKPLSRWVREQYDGTGEGVTSATAVAMATRLAELLGEVHSRGLVYQDFSPNNLMVTDGGDLRLIDPEWAATPGEWMIRAYTPGFAAPEQSVLPRLGPVNGPAADLFSLGTVLCYLATGMPPHFAADEPARRTARERIALLLAAAAPDRPAVAVLAPVVLGLTWDDPEARWTLPRVREYLTGAATDPAATAGGGRLPAYADSGTDATPPGTLRRLLDDGLTYLAHGAERAEQRAGRLWPSGPFGDRTDPCNVQHGAAGVLAVLGRAAQVLDRPELRAAERQVAEWTAARRADVPRLLPGLYFGRAGTAWALYDASVRLGDAVMGEQARDLALSLPVRWPNPDVCHGVAGCGMAQLHFWHATGEAGFLERVAVCADELVTAARHTSDGVFWTVPADFDSTLAGIRHLGFAHGVAGIGAFLLAAGLATGDPRHLDLAVAAGDTLAATAETGSSGARWRSDLRDPPGTGMMHHWCSGSSGVGTFLLRLWQATGDTSRLRLAERAAAAVRGGRWLGGPAACHGLAGDADFLLDVAEAVPDGPYRRWAEDLAEALLVRSAFRDGLLLVPDESGTEIRGDYQTGLAGSVSFLLRLAHGGPRPWMPDAPLAATERPAGA